MEQRTRDPRLEATMHLEAVCYEHAAALIQETPWHVSRHLESLVAAHTAAARRYAARALVAGIDVYNLEAEALGATVNAPTGPAVPSIQSHPCDSVEALTALSPVEVVRGRLALTIEAAQTLRRTLPGMAVRIPVAGPFALAAGLMGMQALIMETITEPARVVAALHRLLPVVGPWFERIRREGFDAVVFESGAAPPMLSPTLFAQVVQPALHAWLQALASTSHRPPTLIIGGDVARVAEHLESLPAAALIAPAETDQTVFVQRLTSRTDIALRINMSAGVFSGNDPAAVERELQRVAAIAAAVPTHRRSRITLGTGVLGYDADPALVDHARACLA
jgi:uroporphyrinogen decarboxylase